MAGFFEALHELVQQDHLAAGDYKPVNCIQSIISTPVVLLSTLEEEGVIAALFELSNDVQQGNLSTFTALQKSGPYH